MSMKKVAMAFALAVAVSSSAFAQEPLAEATALDSPATLQTLSLQDASSVFGGNGAVQLAMLSEEEMTGTTGGKPFWKKIGIKEIGAAVIVGCSIYTGGACGFGF